MRLGTRITAIFACTVALGATLALPEAVRAQDTCAADGIAFSHPSAVQSFALALNGGFLYAVGSDAVPGNGEWRVEKRGTTACDLAAGFGSGGVLQSNPTLNWDVPRAIVADATALYVAGGDGANGSGYDRWRIEKRAASDAALVTAFGTGGVVTTSAAASTARALALAGGSLYVVGDESYAWKIEKRDQQTAALQSGFGTGGVVTSGSGEAHAVVLTGADLIVSGSEGFSSWRLERRNATTGALIYSVVETFPDVGCGPQAAFSAAVDGAFVYLAGEASGQWRVEKRDLATGALVYAQVLTSSGSCDAVHGAVVADGFLYLAGEVGNRWRIEKRSLATGALAPEFGSGGAVTTASSYSEVDAAAVDQGILYVFGLESVAGADTQWRIEKRSPVDGTLVTAPSPTPTPNPGQCAPVTLGDCKTTVRFVGTVEPRDRFTTRCLLTLDASSNGIDPAHEGVLLSLTDADSPACLAPCFAHLATPTRRGRCWKYRAPKGSEHGIQSLAICDVDPARGVYRLTARSQRTDLQCLNTSAPYLLDLHIGDDCSEDCGGDAPSPTPTPTPLPTVTSTPEPGGCLSVTRSPATVANAAPRTNDWLSPAEAIVEDGATALVRVTSGSPSSYLAATGFGFAVPATAHVTGITVTVVRAARDPGSIHDSAMRLVKGGVIGTTDRAVGTAWTTFYTAVVYGGPTDLWGDVLTPADVNGASFGAAIRTAYSNVSGNNDAGVDAMRVTVRYCP